MVDGPLPVGDPIAALAGLGTVVVLSIYWDEVIAKWDGIVAAIQAAFAESARDVIVALEAVCIELLFASKPIDITGVREFQSAIERDWHTVNAPYSAGSRMTVTTTVRRLG